jgi:hypothetical protein
VNPVRAETTLAVRPGAESGPAHGRRPAAIGIALTAVGAVAVIGGAVAQAANEAAYQSLRSDCAAGHCPTGSALDSRRSTIQTLDLVDPIVISIGAGVAALGTILMLTVRTEERQTPAPSIAVFPTQNGLAVAGAF